MKKYIYIALFGFLIESAHAGIFGPSNFDDCVLESMKGVTSDVAARTIYQSCRQKFPEKQVKRNTKALEPWELSSLEGRGKDLGDYFSADILNTNKGITVTQITISVTRKSGGKEFTNFYDKDVDIAPNTTSNVFIKILDGDAGSKFIKWNISAAKGYQQK
ncbi:hypothetical protein G6681_05585 [Polynucleobacter paneuropaeus]|nr:hypothetical protein G6681_05585 [Polynucleobacter paneuropaeus]